jgi:hypothetical protein
MEGPAGMRNVRETMSLSKMFSCLLSQVLDWKDAFLKGIRVTCLISE